MKKGDGEVEAQTRIAELFGLQPRYFFDSGAAQNARKCPFRSEGPCDVAANRNSAANLNLQSGGVTGSESKQIEAIYGHDALPLGVCSAWAKRRFEKESRPWILCPRRLLSVEAPQPVLPAEVARHLDIIPGTKVRAWREFKFVAQALNSGESAAFFDSTFDYLIVPLDEDGQIVGPPYIIEVMTASTRGSGLKPHTVDVLLGRPQRRLHDYERSVYTPNYRQVAQRMLGQLAVKAQAARAWGGKAIWIAQDVLLDYIAETTALDFKAAAARNEGDILIEVFGLSDTGNASLHLKHRSSIRLNFPSGTDDLAAMLMASYIPPFEKLQSSLIKSSKSKDTKSFVYAWQTSDPRDSEIC